MIIFVFLKIVIFRQKPGFSKTPDFGGFSRNPRGVPRGWSFPSEDLRFDFPEKTRKIPGFLARRRPKNGHFSTKIKNSFFSFFRQIFKFFHFFLFFHQNLFFSTYHHFFFVKTHFFIKFFYIFFFIFS